MGNKSVYMKKIIGLISLTFLLCGFILIPAKAQKPTKLNDAEIASIAVTAN